MQRIATNGKPRKKKTQWFQTNKRNIKQMAKKISAENWKRNMQTHTIHKMEYSEL